MVGGAIAWKTNVITTAIMQHTNRSNFTLGVALGIILLTISLIVILVTHSLQQARRIADEVLYFHKGKLPEAGPKNKVLSAPAMAETKQFPEFYGK